MENSSKALLDRIIRGSEPAEFELHDRYCLRISGLARKRLRGLLQTKVDAEDISQETFQTFFEMAERGDIHWQKQGDLWRLLAGIAVNKVRNAAAHYQADKRSLHVEQSLDSKVDAIAQQAALELSEYVQHLIASEKPILRTVLKMRLAGYSQAEIAKHTGRSTRTIRRFLDALKARMAVENQIAADLILQRSEMPADFVVDYSGYQLLKMIGAGSFGKVYLAKQISTGKLFAVKVIRRKWLYCADARRTFVREASLLALLDHSNIVKCFGVGTIPFRHERGDSGCFLVLELIQGVVWNEAVGLASENDILGWIEQLANAIGYAHSKKIVHGDLRSDNLIIDLDKQLRVVDFGLGDRLCAEGQHLPEDDLRAIVRILKATSADHPDKRGSLTDAIDQINNLLSSSLKLTPATCDKIRQIVSHAG